MRFDFVSASQMITKEEFNMLYTTGPLLGKGGFGTVVAGVRNIDQVAKVHQDGL